MKQPASIRLLPILPGAERHSVNTHLAGASNAPAVRGLARDMAPIYAGMYRETPGGGHIPLIGYLAQDTGTMELVGSCAFRLNGSPDGVPEIPYFTFPGAEGRGYARAMAAELVDIARLYGVPRLRSYTARLDAAPRRIVQGLGFHLLGPVDHPAAGLTYAWELDLEPSFTQAAVSGNPLSGACATASAPAA